MQFNLEDLQATTVIEGFGGNSVDSSHLFRAYGLDQPHDFSRNANFIGKLFASTDRYHGKPIVGMTEGKGKKSYLTSDQYTWMLQGHNLVKPRVAEVVETSTTPGISGTEFRVVLDKDWFKTPDVVIPQSNKYPLRIESGPIPRSSGYEYRMTLQGSNLDGRFVPAALLAVGQEFFKTSSEVANEGNKDYGTIQFQSVLEFRSWVGQVAAKFEYTDRAARIAGNDQNRLWMVPYQDEDGNKYKGFMSLAEAKLFDRVYKDIEWSLVYGRRDVAPGPEGYLMRVPAGLRQQLESSNRLTHNGNLTLAGLEDWLQSIYRGRTDADSNARKVILSTGEKGALMFDQMVAVEARSFTTVDTMTITKARETGSKAYNHLAFGAQFTEYKGKNSLDVIVMLDPSKDNPDLCPQKHPVYPDVPIDSWRMEVLDFGSTTNAADGETGDNITMVCEKNSDYYFTSIGKWDPKKGPINDGGQALAGGISGFSTQIEKSYGLWIKDITRCGVIELNVAEV